MARRLAIIVALSLLVPLALAALLAHVERAELLQGCELRCSTWRPASVVGDPAEFCEVACRTSKRPERAFRP